MRTHFRLQMNKFSVLSKPFLHACTAFEKCTIYTPCGLMRVGCCTAGFLFQSGAWSERFGNYHLWISTSAVVKCVFLPLTDEISLLHCMVKTCFIPVMNQSLHFPKRISLCIYTPKMSCCMALCPVICMC